MYTNDFIMRQIELMGMTAARVFKKEVRKEDHIMETRAADDKDSLINKLYDLIDEGKLCEAEDELFFYCKQSSDGELFGIAVEFYNTLNELSDVELLRCDFPREDIAKGLSALLALLNN